MKAKYLIELETKGGEDAPTCERMRTAAYGCGRKPDAIRAVDVTMVEDDVVLGNDLYAYGVKEGGKWKLLDFFNTHKRAANAVKRARANTLRAFCKDKEFAVFVFDPHTSTWK